AGHVEDVLAGSDPQVTHDPLSDGPKLSPGYGRVVTGGPNGAGVFLELLEKTGILRGFGGVGGVHGNRTYGTTAPSPCGDPSIFRQGTGFVPRDGTAYRRSSRQGGETGETNETSHQSNHRRLPRHPRRCCCRTAPQTRGRHGMPRRDMEGRRLARHGEGPL